MSFPLESDMLECGPSLAEDEHRTEEFQQQKQSSSFSSVDSLRSSLAADVMTADQEFTTFWSPFSAPDDPTSPGKRYFQVPLVYCDQTASNRPLNSIERYMEQHCLPLYGNTHTNTSITGSQSTAFVAEARQIVAEETNAKITGKASQDVVLFAGNGTTSAVELLIDCLGLTHACEDPEKRPVVFIGPYEHHSNLIPWRETGCEIVMVPECPTSKAVDYSALEELLQKPEFKNRLKMGTFTAASNVTGKVSDVDQIAATLHRYGALAFFDYATGAPYMKMDMNPPPTAEYPAGMTVKDAIFLSPHKMLGGVGTPGVLIVKKHLVSQVNAPHRSGGGSVFYVTSTHHRFLSNRIERYEGGTPNVTGIFRVGLTFLTKRQAEVRYKALVGGNGSLQDFECAEYERVAAYLKKNVSNLVLLGSDDEGPHLPIFSFLIRFGERFLHYNYVCAILNDVFGIQSRGGCQCAGPYSQKLLGLTNSSAAGSDIPNAKNGDIEEALLQHKERAELLRPGYTRLSLPFKGLRSEEVDYVLKALKWTAENAWSLMCQYRCSHRTGEWRHQSRQGKPLGRNERKWLSNFDFSGSRKSVSLSFGHEVSLKSLLETTLKNADILLAAAQKDQKSISEAVKMTDAQAVLGDDDDANLEELRWYVYPKECAAALISGRYPDPSADLKITGAINPLPIERSAPQSDSSSSERKRNSAFVTRSELPEVSNGRVTEALSLLTFRDGEHTGEATMAEIVGGVDDGELSEACQIFDHNIGEWVIFSSFEKCVKKMKIDQLRCAPDPGTLKTSTMGPSVCSSKKAPRGISAWGKGTVVPYGEETTKKSTDATERRGSSSSQEPKKKQKFKHVRPPPKMMRLINQAMVQWDMVQDGDRLLLGLSGGKDSLSLLHGLLEYRRKQPINFDIEVCTIDPMTPSFDPSPLIPYVKSIGLKYHYIRDDIVERANSAGKGSKVVSSLCAFCARMKRGNLYTCARNNNCNKLVLAQHLDDCAESFMMSVMHNGFLRTMKANYKIDAGDISVIRPLVYCRESLMTGFSKSANLPVINENCPACFEEPKERARVKKMLSREELLNPNFFDSMKRSLLPLMHDDSSSILRAYTEEIVAKSRLENGKRKNGHGNTAEKDTAMPTTSVDLSSFSPSAESGKSPLLIEASEEALIRELARRKSQRLRYSERESQKKKSADKTCATGIVDPTGQVCSLNGGCGSIPCAELME